MSLTCGFVLPLLWTYLSLIGKSDSQVISPFLPNELPIDPNVPRCPAFDPFAYMRHHSNCGMFYRCFWGKAVPMSGCTPGLHFSSLLNICVHPGSLYDDCNIPGGATKYLTPQQRCANGETVWAHPDECALFYNCSMVYNRMPRYFEPYMDECKYPQMFNNETLRCDDFQNVTCGARREPKAGCDYRRNQCPVAHCRPCWLDYPSCVNASDGPHFDSRRLWTPIYVECMQERSMNVKRCMPLNGIPQIFSPDLLQCVSIYDVPRQFNGLRPDCTGKTDRLYPEENGRCNIYIQCLNQTYSGYGQCPSGRNFDPVTQSCKLPSEMCPPCGINQTACIF